MPRFVVALLLLGLVGLWSLDAAGAAPRVLLLGGDHHELARKVRAEAIHAGLAVMELTLASSADDAELLTRHGADAAIRLRSADEAEIYVTASGHHGAYSRILRRQDSDAGVFAQNVVEQVRARLIDLEILVPEENAEPPAPASRAAMAQSPPSEPEPAPLVAPGARPEADRGLGASAAAGSVDRLWLGAGLAGTEPEGGLGSSAQVALGLSMKPARRWTASAGALLPLTENSVLAPEGSADASATMLLGTIGYVPIDLGPAWAADAGVGGGALMLAMRGHATAPLEGAEERVFAGLYFLHAGLAWAGTPWFRVRGALMGGGTAPRPVVRFDGREVAAWGRWFGTASLAAEFGLALSDGGGR